VAGGRLEVVDQDGRTVRLVAERPAVPGMAAQLTLDVEIQRRVEAALGDRVGSVVVLDPRDNAVLALASSPRFDPNGFVAGFADDDWSRLTSDPRRPFQHRATMSAYPTGSIFKVVTMAAGLERGGFRPDSAFACGGSWRLPGTSAVFGDWVKQGNGRLDLRQGLVESCNIVFYEVGHHLNGADPNILPHVAHQFGLGQPTGVDGVSEVAGTVPSPAWKRDTLDEGYWGGDAVNLAIGQGYFAATPLQMANVYSTLAADGRLRAPLLVRKLGPTFGRGPVEERHAEERHRVTVHPESLAAIREAMKKVTSTPRGTAYYAFRGYGVPIAGKTGSAENAHGALHAWFAGYGPADAPEVVVVALVEGGEMGGVVAAPLGRQAFEIALGQR
jgi:penicillin-binding protein 2